MKKIFNKLFILLLSASVAISAPSAPFKYPEGWISMTPGARSGLNVGDVATDPTTLTDGDLWVNSTSDVLKVRLNSTTDTIVTRLWLDAQGYGTGSVATDLIWAAKGDLAVGTGDNTSSILSATTNGYVLTLDSSTATGIKWAAAGTGDVTAASAFGTDNRLIRSDGTGKGLQSSGITLNDLDELSGVASITATTGTISSLVIGGVTILPTGTELNYVDGVTSAIQTQLDAKFGPSTKAEALQAALFAADAGVNDTYTATLSPAITAYTTGASYAFKANTANTGAATINLNALGAKTIKKVAGGITTDLEDNDIRAGQIVYVVYDGTNMQMTSQLGNATSGGALLVADQTFSGINTFSIPLVNLTTESLGATTALTANKSYSGAIDTRTVTISSASSFNGSHIHFLGTAAASTTITWPATTVRQIGGSGYSSSTTFAIGNVEFDLWSNGTDWFLSDSSGSSSSGAPTDATYITQTANGSLSAEQALSSLATGLLKNTTSTGVLSIGVAGTDYLSPGGAAGAPSSITLTNGTGLPVSGIASSTSTALGVGSLEVGAASDTTLARSAAGVLTSEGNILFTASKTKTDEIQAAQIITLSSSGTDTYAGTAAVTITAYTTGVKYTFVSNFSNVGAASLNIDGLGAKTIVKVVGGVTSALVDNDIRSGQVVEVAYDGTNLQIQSTLGNATSATGTKSFGITVDGGGSVITTGSKGFIIAPTARTITGWSIVADGAGALQFDIKKAADGVIPSTSIVASAPPALITSDQIERSTTLTGWTTSVSAYDVFEFTITGTPATITRATLQIFYTE